MTVGSTTKMSRAVLVERLWDYAGQAVLLALVLWLARSGLANFLSNLRILGLSAGFGFLDAEAGFQISQSLIAFSPRSSYLDVVIVAALNSLLVIVLASVLSTLIGLVMAFGRLASHGLIRGAATTYVEVFRNIPLLLQILFWYFSAIALLPGVGDSVAFGGAFLNNRGLFLPHLQVTMVGGWTLVAGLSAFVGLFWLARRWLKTTGRDSASRLAISGAIIALLCFAPLALLHSAFGIDKPQVEGFNVVGGFAVLPELAALTLGLSIYNSTFLAEIFRAGILSVPHGQAEAAATVGLSGVRAALLITLPQALRVALPPAAGQYQTLAKASALAAAIGYPDIMQLVGGTVLSQTNQALEVMALVVLLYAAINLTIALGVNLLNRRLLWQQR